MARIITKEAKIKVMGDPKLYADICLILKLKPGSLSQLIYRDSVSLTNHDVLLRIAGAMGKKPDDILEETAPAAV